MAIRPTKATFTNSSVDVLNAIRNEATINYQNYVPVATPDADVIRTIGATLMDYPNLANEFLQALVTRIGKIIITSKLYENPWTIFKKGIVELGETVEDIFVDLAKPHTFDPEASVAQVYARELPKVHSTFYVMNYQKFYKSTISRAELKTAFLSLDGVTSLISKIITAMYTAANYDEFQTMKYLIAVRLTNGMLYPEETAAATAANAKSIASEFKSVSNDMEFLSSKYNLAGVKTNTLKDNQYLIINSKFDAVMDVEVLASAFNMNKAEFLGHRILVDGFGRLDVDRLDELFAGDSTYHQFTEAELTALEAIPAIVVDKDFFQIYDNLIDTGEKYNEEGLYWNYWLHRWATFAVSPYAQAIAFIPATPSVTSVTVSPSSATIAAGGTVQATATVVVANFAPKGVVWTSDDEDVATVDERGLVTVKADATSGDTCTITATSVFDSTKSDDLAIEVD